MTRVRRRKAVAVAVGVVVAGLVTVLPVAPTSAHEGHDTEPVAAAATGPITASGFADVEAIGNITEPISVAFAPAPYNTAFVALKTGVIKSFDYDSATRQFVPNSLANFADLSEQVENYWDRGLTGIEVDPAFPTRPYIYVNYTYNLDPTNPAATVPTWHAPGKAADQYDECLTPASNSTSDPGGCIVQDRVTRLTAQSADGKTNWVMQPGSERQLFAGGCFHFPSHASGDVAIGADRMLYASMGDGASFDTEDFGQFNHNPCGDPADQGGSLRAQRADSWNGSVFRINPDTGATTKVAYGHRNPWRMAFRAGTNELWNGDVGASGWEEINRLPDASRVQGAVNRGWPCYEGDPGGSARNNAWDLLDKTICETLYAQGTGVVQAPVFSYQTRLNAGPLTAGEDCEHETSSVSGIAFPSDTSNYPTEMRGALFFSDYARQCIWRLSKKGDGSPDPGAVSVFVQRAGTPVDLTVGPGGDLYYVDMGIVDGDITEGAGGVHRIVYNSPVARISTDRTDGDLPLTVRFDGSGSTDPQGRTLTYSWDLDGNGTYEVASNKAPSFTYSKAGVYQAGLQLKSASTVLATASVEIRAGRPPTITATSPDASVTWQVGQRIDFSGAAVDSAGKPIDASGITWRLQIRHCPSDVCHTHPLQAYTGTTGSFTAPEHEYPSYLLLSMTAKDANGLTTERTVQLSPRAVDLSFASSPGGLPVAVAGVNGVTRQTFIVGSTFTVSAPLTQQQGARRWTFRGWSDGGAATHQVVAPGSAQTLVAAYDPVTSRVTVRAKGGKLKLQIDGKTHKGTWVESRPVGTTVSVVAPKKQTRKGVRYVFKKWKDGGERQRTVAVGEGPVELVAVYRKAGRKR